MPAARRIPSLSLFALLAALCLPWAAPAWAAAPAYDLSQLSGAGLDGSSPVINDGGQVAFMADDGTGNSQIYLYTPGSGTAQITTGTAPKTTLDLNNNGQIAWGEQSASGYDIFLYDPAGPTTTQITNDAAVDFFPSLNDSGHIVWRRFDSGNQIMYYDGATAAALPLSSVAFDEPRIGNADTVVWVWTDGADTEIFLYDIGTGTPTRLTDNLVPDSAPDINDLGWITWIEGATADPQTVRIYDPANPLTTPVATTAVAAPGTYNGAPKVYGAGNVAWDGLDADSKAELYLWDGGAVTQLTTTSRSNWQVTANTGGDITWVQNVNDTLTVLLGKVNPLATRGAETCNGLDDDLDWEVDEGLALGYYSDGDGDGYGDDATFSPGCTNPGAGWVTQGGDCDDTDINVHPGATEVCNGIDDNCDGTIDEGTTTRFYPDADVDTYGDDAAFVDACANPGGYILTGGDCDDTDAAVNPAAAEVCNQIDDNCAGGIDEGLNGLNYHADADADFYGDPAVTQYYCNTTLPASGWVNDDRDCDDTDPAVHPGQAEACNGIDDNCDGTIDEGTTTRFYADADSDNYGDDASFVDACANPGGYILTGGDCDDTDAAVNPGATEVCNHIDDNCDTQVDEGQPLITLYTDADADTFGDPATGVDYCPADTPPPTSVADNTDCDDTDMAVYPGQTEVCNGIDDNCDGSVDEGLSCAPPSGKGGGCAVSAAPASPGSAAALLLALLASLLPRLLKKTRAGRRG